MCLVVLVKGEFHLKLHGDGGLLLGERREWRFPGIVRLVFDGGYGDFAELLHKRGKEYNGSTLLKHTRCTYLSK